MEYRISVCFWLSVFFSIGSGYQDLSISQRFSRLEALVSEMAEQNIFLKNELDKVKSGSTVQRAEIQKLQAENIDLKREVAYIKERFIGQNASHSTVNEKNIEHAITTDSDNISNERIKGSSLEENTPTVVKESTRNRRLLAPPTTIAASTPKPSGKVGFYAVMTNHNEQLGIHQIIKFQKMVTNIGNGFDSKTSVFKAPVGGLYYFSAQLLTHLHEDFEADLIQNGATLVRCYVGNGNTHGSSTLSAVLHLTTGDDVWIEINKSVYNDGNVRIYGNAFSWFSGFLITTT